MGSYLQSLGLESKDDSRTTVGAHGLQNDATAKLLTASGYTPPAEAAGVAQVGSGSVDVKPFVFSRTTDNQIKLSESVPIGSNPIITRSAVIANLLSPEPTPIKAAVAAPDPTYQNLTQVDTPPRPTTPQPEVPVLRLQKEPLPAVPVSPGETARNGAHATVRPEATNSGIAAPTTEVPTRSVTTTASTPEVPPRNPTLSNPETPPRNTTLPSPETTPRNTTLSNPETTHRNTTLYNPDTTPRSTTPPSLETTRNTIPPNLETSRNANVPAATDLVRNEVAPARPITGNPPEVALTPRVEQPPTGTMHRSDGLPVVASPGQTRLAEGATLGATSIRTDNTAGKPIPAVPNPLTSRGDTTAGVTQVVPGAVPGRDGPQPTRDVPVVPVVPAAPGSAPRTGIMAAMSSGETVPAVAASNKLDASNYQAYIAAHPEIRQPNTANNNVPVVDTTRGTVIQNAGERLAAPPPGDGRQATQDGRQAPTTTTSDGRPPVAALTPDGRNVQSPEYRQTSAADGRNQPVVAEGKQPTIAADFRQPMTDARGTNVHDRPGSATEVRPVGTNPTDGRTNMYDPKPGFYGDRSTASDVRQSPNLDGRPAANLDPKQPNLPSLDVRQPSIPDGKQVPNLDARQPSNADGKQLPNFDARQPSNADGKQGPSFDVRHAPHLDGRPSAQADARTSVDGARFEPGNKAVDRGTDLASSSLRNTELPINNRSDQPAGKIDRGTDASIRQSDLTASGRTDSTGARQTDLIIKTPEIGLPKSDASGKQADANLSRGDITTNRSSDLGGNRSMDAVSNRTTDSASTRASDATTTSRASDIGSGKLPDANANRISDAASSRAGEVASSRPSDVAPNRLSDVVSNRASDVASNRASDIATNRASDVASNRPSDITINRASDVASNRASDITTNRVSDVASNRASDVTTNRTSDAVSNRTSDAVSNRPSDVTSNRASDVGSNRAPDGGSNRALDGGSNRATDGGSNRATDVTSNRTSDVSSINRSDAAQSRTNEGAANRTTDINSTRPADVAKPDVAAVRQPDAGSVKQPDATNRTADGTIKQQDAPSNRPADLSQKQPDAGFRQPDTGSVRSDAQPIRAADSSAMPSDIKASESPSMKQSDGVRVDASKVGGTAQPEARTDSNSKSDGTRVAATKTNDASDSVKNNAIDKQQISPIAPDLVATQKEAAAIRQVLNELKHNQNLSAAEVLELPSFKEALRLLDSLKLKDTDGGTSDGKQNLTTAFVDAMRLSDFLKVLEKASEIEQKKIHKQQWAARSLAQNQHRVRYLVKKDDTLESIAEKTLGDVRFVQLLITINRAEIIFTAISGKPMHVVYEGQYLWIPTPNEVAIHKKHYFNSNSAAVRGEPIAPEAETPIMVEEYEAPTTVREFATRLRSVTAPPVAASVAAPGNPPSSPMAIVLLRLRFAGNRNSVNLDEVDEAPSSSERRRHKVRLGETLQSIAVHDPLMQDVNMWALICRVNDFETSVDAAGRPRAQLNRGDLILLPNEDEIQEFKLLGKLMEIAELAGHQADVELAKKRIQGHVAPKLSSAAGTQNGSPAPRCKVDRKMAIEKLSERARMIQTDNDDTSYSIKLQRATVDGKWVTVASYESKDGKTLRNTYKIDGSKNSLEVGLPAAVSREMATEDFQRNWKFYYNRYTSLKTDTLELDFSKAANR